MEKKNYANFIQKIKRNEKQDDGSYVTVSKDYMTVDGRVMEFVDIHKDQGMRFKFTRRFEKDDEGNIICHAKIFSAIFGIAEATAGAYGKTLVDRSNPYENAETSAYGRCLGFFGLGLLGGGIASAEEINDSLERHKNSQKSKPKENDNKLTSAQLKLIHKLSQELGLTDGGHSHLLNMNFKVSSSSDLTKHQASEFIEILKGYRKNAG